MLSIPIDQNMSDLVCLFGLEPFLDFSLRTTTQSVYFWWDSPTDPSGCSSTEALSRADSHNNSHILLSSSLSASVISFHQHLESLNDRLQLLKAVLMCIIKVVPFIWRTFLLALCSEVSIAREGATAAQRQSFDLIDLIHQGRLWGEELALLLADWNVED